jgi:Zn-dependent peptidase ImmA (M78 family)
MTVGCYKSGFRVQPLSISKIRTTAMSVRQLILPADRVDLEEFLEGLIKFGITYDVVEDSYLPPGAEASCIPEDRVIYITLTTFEAVKRNDERARFTIFHELGHLLLAHRRALHRDTTAEFPIFENSEWQADQFAAEILMPLEVIRAKNLTAAWELQAEFGVSHLAANKRLENLRKKGEIKNA